jgi:hypothetical protein
MVASSPTALRHAPAVLDAEVLFGAARDTVQAAMAPAFDALRAEYAAAVSLGFAPRSMLASRDVERLVDALERCSLGPFARRV